MNAATSSVAARPPSDDDALVARLLAGDERAFAALVQEMHGSLVRIAQIFVGSRAIAEEVAQETWMGLLTGLSGFERRSALRTWIFRILTNRAKTRGVREKRSVPFSSIEEEHEDAVDPSRFKQNGRWESPPRLWDDDTPERILAARETVALLEQTIDALPPTQRAVFVLRDVEAVDAEDACNVLGISETNQRVLLHRARSKVRAALENHLDR